MGSPYLAIITTAQNIPGTNPPSLAVVPVPNGAPGDHVLDIVIFSGPNSPGDVTGDFMNQIFSIGSQGQSGLIQTGGQLAGTTLLALMQRS